jgi:hypothetical protein
MRVAATGNTVGNKNVPFQGASPPKSSSIPKHHQRLIDLLPRVFDKTSGLSPQTVSGVVARLNTLDRSPPGFTRASLSRCLQWHKTRKRPYPKALEPLVAVFDYEKANKKATTTATERRDLYEARRRGGRGPKRSALSGLNPPPPGT